MFHRIQHFFNATTTSRSEDPGARGAAKLSAGGMLVVEGIFGVVRRRRDRNGNRQTGKILDGLFELVFINIARFIEEGGMGSVTRSPHVAGHPGSRLSAQKLTRSTLRPIRAMLIRSAE